MDLLDGLRAFIATAQTGSFTAAARQLGLSNRLTSKYVAELEARLGTRLFQRTTRRVGLTAAGEDLLARAPALLDDFDDMLAGIAEESRGYTGTIRVSASVTFGETYIAPMLGRFAAEHPALAIDLRLNDAFADLASEGIDVAFRIGTSDMLSVKQRLLGRSCALVVASPDYIREHGAPRHPRDLEHHACIIDSNRRDPRRWTFQDGDGTVTATVTGRFTVNSARAACNLAVDGLGIASGPRFAFRDAIANGQLVELLSGFRPDGIPVSAVYLEGRVLPRKLRALIDFAARDLRGADVL